MLIQIPKSLKGASRKVGRASDIIKLAEHNVKQKVDESLLYPLVYSAARIACEGYLWLRGFKVKSGLGHHIQIFSNTEKLLNKELPQKELEKELKRIKRMPKKRHSIEYDALNTSQSEFNQAIKDTKALIKKIDSLIIKENPQKKLIP